MSTSTLIHRSLAALLASAVIVHGAGAGTASAAAAGSGTPTGAERVAINAGPQRRSTIPSVGGQQAIDRLGDRLADLATRTGVTPEQLRRLLLDDDSIRLSDTNDDLVVGDALGGTGATVTTGSTDSPIWPVGDTLRLHSRPGAPLKIYLDFNGHTTTGTVWNAETGWASFTTPVWGRDGDATTFNSAEAAAIQHAYASVAEDYAPFNVDVTTEDPGVDGIVRSSLADTNYGVRVVVGRNTWLNVSNSGYARIGTFGTVIPDTPAYCFADYYTPTKQIAECISHEAGHTLGLFHDGTTVALAGQDPNYYGGHGNWAPIMGNSYGRPVTQWSSGQYPYANNQQNDLNQIASVVGWVADDYLGTTASTATLPAGTTRGGLINSSGEADVFRFSLLGTRSMNIQTWEWAQWVDSNLNMRVRLLNSAGTVILTSSPNTTLRTNFNVTLNAGTYFVVVDGVGEGTVSTGYSNYDSLGFYYVLLQFI